MTRQGVSPTRRALRKLARQRAAMISLVVLVLLYLGAIFAPFLAPYYYDNVLRAHSYAPPNLHFFDEHGRFHLRPFVYAMSYEWDASYQRRYVEDRSRRYPVRFFYRSDDRQNAYNFLFLFPTNRHLVGVDPPARVYLMGADEQGRDLWSRILFGSRISLSVGFVGAGISFVLGMLIGGASGYAGGKTDNLIMRLCEMVMLAPAFYLMLALRAALPAKIPSWQVYLLIVAILSFIGWAGLARVIRGMVLSLSRQEYVLAARAVGAGHATIILRHILPNTLSYAIIAVTVSIPGYILGETGLSLIGLGIQEPYASWGNLLSAAMSIPEMQFHPWILVTGLFILVAVMCFNFLGDGLRDAFDPRSLAQPGAGDEEDAHAAP
ncbi:MAG: ABC transporter permease [Planctomycetota bacterium]